MIYDNFQPETGVPGQQTYKKQGNVMLKKIKNFLEDTSGSILPTMAVLTIPLGIAAGAAVDYTRYVNMRSEVQVGIDAAGLASSVELENIKQRAALDGLSGEAFDAKVQTELTKYASSFLEANLKSEIAKNAYTLTARYIPPKADQRGGIEMIAEITYDTIFGGKDGKDGGTLLFTDKIHDELTSIITTGNRTIEVALVMDNSGSMARSSQGKTRIRRMKDASKELVKNLYASARNSQLKDPVKFSLIPFSASVNVGPLGHANHDGRFLDVRGFNPVHNENLAWRDTFRSTINVERPGGKHIVRTRPNGVNNWLTRFTAYELLGETWGGCVEMRPWPHNVLDTYVQDRGGFTYLNSRMDADGDGKNDGAKALFVPMFAPDEPDSEFAKDFDPGSHPSRERDYAFGVDHDYDSGGGYRNRYLYDFRDFVPENPDLYIQLYTDDDPEVVSKSNSIDENDDNIGDPSGNGDEDFQNVAEDMRGSTNKINRTNWVFKYQSNVQLRTLNQWIGPNRGCTTTPITALTTDQQTVDSAIDAMSATGTTNIQQGLTWGWRSLSPGLPLDQGRPKDDPVNLKFIILLTDGDNFYPEDNTRFPTPNESDYGAWGYMRPDTHFLKHAITGEPTHNRIAEGVTPADLVGTIYEGQTFDLTPTTSGQFTDLMNVHTAQACENIKADGVSIYTIVYDLESPSTTALMEACAGSGIVEEKAAISGVKFFHKAEGANLDDTFAEIAQSISAIRISQ